MDTKSDFKESIIKKKYENYQDQDYLYKKSYLMIYIYITIPNKSNRKNNEMSKS